MNTNHMLIAKQLTFIGLSLIAICSPLFGEESNGKCALLIGVRNYDPDQLSSKPSAEKDVSKLAELLIRNGFDPKHVAIMTSSTGIQDASQLPTLSNIRQQLVRLGDSVESNDIAILAFSGHGLQKVEGQYLLCPLDADLEDSETLLPLDEVYAALESCSAKQKLLLLDGMSSKALSDDLKPTVRSQYSTQLPQFPPTPRDTAVFVACATGEATSLRQESNRDAGDFFSAIHRGLQGDAVGADGSVTLPDLERYVKNEFQGSDVHPALYNNTAGLFVIASQSLGDDEMVKIQKLIRADRYDDAMQIVARQLQNNPNDAIAMAQRSRLLSYKAEQFRDYSNIDKSLSDANRAIELAPHEPLPYIARSNVYRIQQKYEQAFADAQSAINRDPNCVMAHVICAFAMHHLHDLEGMKREAKIGMEIDPEHPEARAIYVGYLFAKGRLDEGHLELDRAIAITPDMPALYFLKGYGLEKQGKHRQAVEEYSRAISLNDQIPGYYCRRAVSYANAGDFNAAQADITAAESIDPDYVDIASARTMTTQAKLGYGHSDRAIAEGLKQNPESADLWQGKAFNHYNRREFSQAMDAFKKVLEINPGYGEAHMGLGMTYAQLGKNDEALLHLNRATRHKEFLSRAYFEKSSVYVSKGDFQAALNEVELALKYEPQNQVYQQQRHMLQIRGAQTGKLTGTKLQPEQLGDEAALKKATVNGKYSQLLTKLAVPSDFRMYGNFYDYGFWNMTQYAGRQSLPLGHWVYVYPNWYIWQNSGSASSNQENGSHVEFAR